MRSALLSILCLLLLSSTLLAAETDPGILKLIGPDARTIFGIDLERYTHSQLAVLFPAGEDGTRQLIVVMGDEHSGRQPLTIKTGMPPGSREKEREDDDATTVQVNENTSISGDPEMVRASLERWRQNKATGGIANQVRRLSSEYDNWFLLVRPLDRLNQPAEPKRLKYRDELIHVMQEVRGGIRLGRFNEVNVEFVMATSEDAIALSTLARWLPGFMQLNENGLESELVELAENLSVRVEGNIVFASFILPEDRLNVLVRQRKARGQSPVF